MEVADLFGLTNWFQKYVPNALKRYERLHSVLQHNASQQQKQPVEETLTSLLEELSALPLTDLNLQQVEHLDELKVGQFLGSRGVEHVKSVVMQSNYDPASSASKIEYVVQQVRRASSVLQTLQETLKEAAFEPDEVEDELDAEMAMARIQFRQDASITNIAELKKWSSDWNDIVRGIGHLVGETPHDMRVVGASKGSIVVCVTGSMMLISTFAFMSKKVSGIVLDGLQVLNAIEELRHKRISNRAVEDALKTGLKQRKEGLVDELFDDLKERAGDAYQAEHDAHLRTAVKKYVEFSEKGGEIDYLQPPEPEEDDDDEEATGDGGGGNLLFQELRELISEVRDMKAQTLLLEDQTGDDG